MPTFSGSRIRVGRMGMIGTKAGPPTRKTLSKAFGFPSPLPFVKLLQTIYDVAGDPYHAEHLYESLLGIRPEGASARYQEQTPPELFPIGGTGGDGEHYGYVIHALEIPSDDYPLGSYMPGVHDGVTYLGRSTREAVENIVAYRYGKRPKEVPDGVRQVLSKLRMRIDPNRARRVRWVEGNQYRRVPPPRLPAGYRHVMTSDGVGVVAPAKAFGREPLVEFESPTPPARFIEAAQRALDSKADAAALFYLKEGRDHAAGDRDETYLKECRKLVALLARTYRRFGRGLTARYVY
jgi:hypothetical protein